MPSLKQRLIEDRMTRDAAKGVLQTDLEFIRDDMERQGIASRLFGSATESASIAAEGTLDFADENRGKVAGGALLTIAGAVAWIFRKEIVAALDTWLPAEEAADAQAPGSVEHSEDLAISPAETEYE